MDAHFEHKKFLSADDGYGYGVLSAAEPQPKKEGNRPQVTGDRENNNKTEVKTKYLPRRRGVTEKIFGKKSKIQNQRQAKNKTKNAEDLESTEKGSKRKFALKKKKFESSAAALRFLLRQTCRG